MDLYSDIAASYERMIKAQKKAEDQRKVCSHAMYNLLAENDTKTSIANVNTLTTLLEDYRVKLEGHKVEVAAFDNMCELPNTNISSPKRADCACMITGKKARW